MAARKKKAVDDTAAPAEQQAESELAASGEEAVTLAAHLRPDVVLCDLRLGDGMDGVQTTAALRALDGAPAVLILTTFDRDAEVLGAIEAGAAGYLLTKELENFAKIWQVAGSARQDLGLTPESHAVALIELKDGRRVALAVFLSGSTADAATREAIVAEAGRTVLKSF